MKKIALLFTVLTLMACKQNDKKEEITEEAVTVSQTGLSKNITNKLVDDPEEEGAKMLLGPINYKGFRKDHFPWFQDNFNAHQLDKETTQQLEKYLKDVTITAFMGTWCEDSQREIPILFKIMNATNFPADRFNLIAVSHDKDTPDGLEKGYNIEYVPTIILSRDGKEIGRFVEAAQESLEKDLFAIASGKPYKHIYEE